MHACIWYPWLWSTHGTGDPSEHCSIRILANQYVRSTALPHHPANSSVMCNHSGSATTTIPHWCKIYITRHLAATRISRHVYGRRSHLCGKHQPSSILKPWRFDTWAAWYIKGMTKWQHPFHTPHVGWGTFTRKEKLVRIPITGVTILFLWEFYILLDNIWAGILICSKTIYSNLYVTLNKKFVLFLLERGFTMLSSMLRFLQRENFEWVLCYSLRPKLCCI
jgi:hypothetical protein